MKKFRIFHRQKPRSFAEKFSAEAAFFGSPEGGRPQKSPYIKKIAVCLLCMLGGVALTGGILLLSTLWQVTDVEAAEVAYKFLTQV